MAMVTDREAAIDLQLLNGDEKYEPIPDEQILEKREAPLLGSWVTESEDLEI